MREGENTANNADWIEDIIRESTGNVTPYEEFELACFDVFRKLRDNGYPDMMILALVCDQTKLPMTIPAMFDKWRSNESNE